jgi:hypothetical protein
MKKITNQFVDEPKDDYTFYEIQTYGHTIPVIYFDPESHSTRGVNDGIILHFPGEAGWLISYRDLMEMARLATEARTKPIPKPFKGEGLS